MKLDMVSEEELSNVFLMNLSSLPVMVVSFYFQEVLDGIGDFDSDARLFSLQISSVHKYNEAANSKACSKCSNDEFIEVPIGSRSPTFVLEKETNQ